MKRFLSHLGEAHTARVVSSNLTENSNKAADVYMLPGVAEIMRAPRVFWKEHFFLFFFF